MDEQKKPAGRPQIYQGWQPEQRGRRRMPAQRPQEEKRKGTYRPLEVVEQQVTEQQKPGDGKLTEEIKEEPKTVQRPDPEGEKVIQIPVQKQVQQSVRRPQSPVQRTSQPPAQKPMQRPPQPPAQKPMQRPPQPEQQKVTAGKRRREQENDIKMHFLWLVLGVLCIVLAGAIFYEIILGHGIKETGADRMEEQKQELVIDTEQNNIEILTPGGELVSEIKERENRRALRPQAEETDMQ